MIFTSPFTHRQMHDQFRWLPLRHPRQSRRRCSRSCRQQPSKFKTPDELAWTGGYCVSVLELSSLDLEEIALALQDQTDQHWLDGHPDLDLP